MERITEMKVVVDEPALVWVVLSGALDSLGVREIQREFLDYCSVIEKSVIVDLSWAKSLTSVGVSMLLSGKKSLEHRGWKLVLFRPSAFVELVITNMRLQEVFQIFHDEKLVREVLQAIQGPDQPSS